MAGFKLKLKQSKWQFNLIVVLEVLLIISLLYSYNASKHHIKSIIAGESMVPTFQNKQRVEIDRSGKIKRFSNIVFNPPNLDQEMYLKRVIGLPGEEIQYKGGQLYINNYPVSDPYSLETADFKLSDFKNIKKIPKNQYFVLGDNRKNSLDSRSFGLVDRKDIFGIVSEPVKKKSEEKRRE